LKDKKENTMTVNRQWLLAARPDGMIGPQNFGYVETAIPEISNGEVLVKNLYLSFDPTQRNWMVDRPGYLPPVAIGETMRAGSVSQVVDSKHNDFAVGELVQTTGCWQDYAVVAPGQGPTGINKLPPGVSPEMMLSILGITGMTAYFGLLEHGQPKAGETVLVSGAAGATGSVVGQIAKLMGCRVVGIAGGPEKCAWLKEVAGFDA
jgi:NADPH-dependent curcumin reductase CurA